MGADRSRRRTSTYGALGGCLAALLVIGASLPASSADGQASLGSSCARPWQAIYRVGGSNGGFEGDQTHIYMSGTPRLLNWLAYRPRSVICSARIQLANGRWVGPTGLYPYTTPTPTGGEYKAPHAPLRTAIVTAARSPVPPGASCNYPIFSGKRSMAFPAREAIPKTSPSSSRSTVRPNRKKRSQVTLLPSRRKSSLTIPAWLCAACLSVNS
jgi:hypothetical protein